MSEAIVTVMKLDCLCKQHGLQSTLLYLYTIFSIISKLSVKWRSSNDV